MDEKTGGVDSARETKDVGVAASDGSGSDVDQNEEDKYKDYYTTNMFEGLKKADPKVLTAIGIIAVILIVVIILVFGGGQAGA